MPKHTFFLIPNTWGLVYKNPSNKYMVFLQGKCSQRKPDVKTAECNILIPGIQPYGWEISLQIRTQILRSRRLERISWFYKTNIVWRGHMAQHMAHATVHTWRSKAPWKKQLSFSPVCVLGIELRPSALSAGSWTRWAVQLAWDWEPYRIVIMFTPKGQWQLLQPSTEYWCWVLFIINK